MQDQHTLAFMRIPFSVLESLDSRELHFWMQSVHHLIRLLHILAMGAFFGAVATIDLRLLGWQRTVPLRAIAIQVLPLLYFSFGVTIVTGVALFLYDPVHTGSHAYFTPKLILIVAGMAVVAYYRKTRFGVAMRAEARMPSSARLAGALSLALWTGVVVCSCLNTEAAPKVYLR